MRRDNKHIRPPRLANWLLERFIPADTLEEVQGDLLELYQHWVETDGLQAARHRYTWLDTTLYATVIGVVNDFILLLFTSPSSHSLS